MILCVILLGLTFTSTAQNQTTVNKSFSIQLKNSSDKTPNLADLRNGNIKLVYLLNGDKVPVEFVSCIVIHTSKGTIQAPFACTNRKKQSSVQNYLKRLVLNKGDKVFLEDFTINFKGKKVKPSTGVKLSL